jgi:hypothetical protein
MGAIPGEPKSALSLLKSGFWVGVMPGMLLQYILFEINNLMFLFRWSR